MAFPVYPSQQLGAGDVPLPSRYPSQQPIWPEASSPTQRPSQARRQSQGYISPRPSGLASNQRVSRPNGISNHNGDYGFIQRNGIYYPNGPGARSQYEERSEEHLWIAIMGVTGSGKSSFIKQCTRQNVTIGHDLISCTGTVEDYTFTVGRTIVHLVDTPGFDDTYRKDTEVLRDISTWLGDTYKAKIYLSGIIYLHRITDHRMQGSAKHNLHLFKKLIGEDCFPRVVLATTMWENVDPYEGRRREAELKSTEEFWGFMKKKGSKVMRHERNDRQSAMKVLDHFLTRQKEELTLAIQDEMVHQSLSLDETGAGRQIDEDITLLQDKHRRELKHLEVEIKEAKDQESMESIQMLRRDYERKIEEAHKDRESIKANVERLLEDQRLKLEEIERKHALEAENWQRDKEEFESLKSQADADDRGYMNELLRREQELEKREKDLEARHNSNERQRRTRGPNDRTLSWIEWLAGRPHTRQRTTRLTRT